MKGSFCRAGIVPARERVAIVQGVQKTAAHVQMAQAAQRTMPSQAAQVFSLALAGESRASAAAVAAMPTATLTGLLAIQAETDRAERRKKALRRGHDLLDALESLKLGFLSGKVDHGALSALRRRLADQAGTGDDPALDGLLQHVELRAAVELAKLEKR
jgi:Class II flagellar assembly regulator